MMIKSLHTIVTNGAMGAARRTVKHACITILNPNRNAINHNFFCPWELEARSLSSLNWHWRIIPKLLFWRMWITWNNTRVPGWCEKKKNQHLSISARRLVLAIIQNIPPHCIMDLLYNNNWGTLFWVWAFQCIWSKKACFQTYPIWVIHCM